MKKSILLFSCMLICVIGFSQQFHAEIYSGYSIPNYDHPAYEIEDYSEAGSIPIGIRIAAGHEYVQLGVEYRQNLTNTTFTFDKLPGVSTSFDESYYGGFLRVNISSLPVYRAGLILKGGAGYYTYEQTINVVNESIVHEFDKKLGFHGGLGVSGPIYANLHLELGYSYHWVDRDNMLVEGFESFPGSVGYKAGYHAITFGLSVNLMITEKGKAGCKNKRHRSKGKHGRGGWFAN